MYMRLWWKDARQIWPIWFFVALAAGASQWMALSYFSPQVRHGALCWIALVWTILYTVVTGAAAFAGEREMGTLTLLDILPAARGIIWTAKSSFAFASTLILGSLLMGMAAAQTDHWTTDYFGPEQPLTPWLAMRCAFIVPLALSWALLWSSILSNALTAALAGIGSTGACLIFILVALDERYSRPLLLHVNGAPAHSHSVYAVTELLTFLLVLVVSKLFLTRSWQSRPLSLKFQSPIVMTSQTVTAAVDRSIQSDTRQPVRMAISQYTRGSAGLVLTPDQSSRPSFWREAWHLAWKTVRQAAKTWTLMTLFGVLIPLLLIASDFNIDPSLLMMTNVIIALVAGVNVFGVENRERTQRFLTHHGARPWLVWSVKLAVWSFVVGAILAGQLTAVYTSGATFGPIRDSWFEAIVSLPLIFAVAVLCGMAITRGLTAVVIALIFSIATCVPHYLLMTGHLLPPLGLLATAIALVAVSATWRIDWLLSRPAPGKWLRLGAALAAASALLIGSYGCYRAWSIPDIGPIPAPRAWSIGASQPVTQRNAASLYRLSFDTMQQQHPLVTTGLDAFRQSLALIHEAAALPQALDSGQIKTLSAGPDTILEQLGALVMLDARDRLTRHDLPDVWNDLIALFRLSRHFSNGAGIGMASSALRLEREGLDLAMEWAVAANQSVEQLRTALTAFHELPPMTPADEILRAELRQIEKTINLPNQQLKDVLESLANGSDQQRIGFWPATWVDLLTTPWERARAVKATRVIGNWMIQKTNDKAGLELRAPAKSWSLEDHRSYEMIDYFRNTTPLARMLIPNEDWLLKVIDWNQTGHGALEQVLAIRIWQFKHNGAFPDALEKLVPQELPSLPLDPFSGRQFRYELSDGTPRVPLGMALRSTLETYKVQTSGYRLLESVGVHPDNKLTNTDRGLSRSLQPVRNAIIFPIPPLRNTGEPKK